MIDKQKEKTFRTIEYAIEMQVRNQMSLSQAEATWKKLLEAESVDLLSEALSVSLTGLKERLGARERCCCTRGCHAQH